MTRLSRMRAASTTEFYKLIINIIFPSIAYYISNNIDGNTDMPNTIFLHIPFYRLYRIFKISIPCKGYHQCVWINIIPSIVILCHPPHSVCLDSWGKCSLFLLLSRRH